MKKLIVALGLVWLFVAPSNAQFQSVRVQVIDRGQADGILIRTPNSQWVVIDGGEDNRQAEAMVKTWGVNRLVGSPAPARSRS